MFSKPKLFVQQNFPDNLLIITADYNKINILVGVQNFNGNPNDTITLTPALKHVEKLLEEKFTNAIVNKVTKEKRG